MKKLIKLVIPSKMSGVNLIYSLTISTLIRSLATESAPIHRSHFCSSSNATTTFSLNTTNIYQSHSLKNLLSSLSSSAALGEFFAQKTTRSSTETIYGSYLCRGDLDAAACNDCVSTAADEAPDRCPNVPKEAVLWYDECKLRYSSNRSFFGIMEEKPSSTMVDQWNGTRQEGFRKALEEAIMSESALVEAVSNDINNNKKKYFRTKEVKVASFQTIYSLVQCTPDLSSGECKKCLRDAMRVIGSCCEGKEGANILFPSCNVRYELFPFYGKNITTKVTEPPLQTKRPPKGKGRVLILVIIAVVISIVFVSLAYFVFGCYLSHIRNAKRKSNATAGQNGNNEITSTDCLRFDLITIETATNNFSDYYKLGRGGFGEVYKGVLPDGQQIAVKRPLNYPGRGSEQFKNEVALVAKLQHRNLVRLLGYCLEGGETMLVYEFVPNKSLDYFLFDPEKRILLDWPTRCKIIGGIARGILYLHEDSRLRIIHRDLKASNILLDGEMNPKLADFGIAKMFGLDDQTEGSTKTIIGTYGYMAPEYIMGGLYSTKSDVFSFGIILLEILSGTKNSSFHFTKLASCLLSHASRLWNDGKGLEFMDPVLKTSCPENEFLRHMHIGLLCVQEDAYIRPTMSFVSTMLKSDQSVISLSKPGHPPFTGGRFSGTEDDERGPVDECSTSRLTASVLEPRLENIQADQET